MQVKHLLLLSRRSSVGNDAMKGFINHRSDIKTSSIGAITRIWQFVICAGEYSCNF